MIKDEKLRTQLLRSFPKISDRELIRIAKEHMPQYVVYKQVKPGKYECYCTNCEKHYINDTVSGRRYVPVVGHKQKGTCLECGKDIIFLARGKGKGSIWNSQNFAVYRLKGDNVYIQTYQIVGVFTELGRSNFDYNEKGDIYERRIYPMHRYALTPNGAQKWDHWWGYNYKKGDYVRNWEYKKTESTPNFSYGMYNSDHSYIAIDTECISKSFLRYAVEAAAGTQYSRTLNRYSVKFLSECCTYPNIEYLLKTGFGYIIEQRLLSKYMSGLRIKWRQNDVKKMLGLNKLEMEELANTSCETLNVYLRLRKLDPSMEAEERAVYAQKTREIDTLKLLIEKTDLSLRKALYYIDKQRMPLRDWKDYIEQCEKLEYDIKDTAISRPKDFYEAHERLSKILATKANREKQKRFDEVNKTRQDMPYIDEELGLMIVLPRSINEILREGSIQNHCVGGYADRHAEGKLHILFLRKIDEPQIPYYTMEVSTKGTIIQCRGYANDVLHKGGKPKGKEIIEFEKRYQKYLRKIFKKKSARKAKAA